jgi:hypothetical protein
MVCSFLISLVWECQRRHTDRQSTLSDGPDHIAVAIQDLLICLEMVPASIAHRYVIIFM